MTIRLKWHMKMARNSSTKNNLEITSLKNNAKLYNEGLFLVHKLSEKI